MKTLKYTLIADGSSDITLMRIIKWSLNDLYPKLATEYNFADFRHFHKPPKSLKQKVDSVNVYYPCDILFIHRDAEKNDCQLIDKRIEEIKNEIGNSEFERTVCVIPVKMMETWLLINEEAIKQASGNRNYNQPLNLPALRVLEKEKNPKAILHDLLKTASGLKGRRLSAFNPNYAVHLVAEYIEDYKPLRKLQAFNAFEMDLIHKVSIFLTKNEWNLNHINNK